jgi:putative addiction module component (TIGR02574 family)
MSDPRIDIETLTKQERWELIQRLWTSLGDVAVELSPAQRAELDRRSEALDRDIAAEQPLGSSWDDVRARIRGEALAGS